MQIRLIFVLLFFCVLQIFAQKTPEADDFIKANNLSWRKTFEDDCKKSWNNKWFMDGMQGHIVPSKQGMDYFAGKEAYNDAGHTVLWTKRIFSGDIKIEYDFTRLDSSFLGVNILYVLATGSGKEPYKKNIFKWKELRRIPAMAEYYNHMNTYHISYAAFSFNKNESEYIRARRYMPETGKGIEGTALRPEYKNSGLFATGIKHHITVIKRGDNLYMKVVNPTQTRFFYFDTSDFPTIQSGRIGIRQMWTRASRYANIKVYEL